MQRKEKMFEEFYQKYAPEEREMIVLIRNCIGAGYHSSGDFWEMTVISLGMVFCDTGEVNLREGRLEWPVTEIERNSKKEWRKFQKGQICRLRVRRLLDELTPAHISPEQFNSWAVIEVLEPSVPCPQLEAVWEEYQKPVLIEDEVLGTLKLNREFEQLEGEILWHGEQVSLSLEIDLQDSSTWDVARSMAKKLVTNSENWDKTMRKFAAKELTELANEWQINDDEDENANPITENTFAERIALTELSVTCEGDFTAYYDDDDLFLGHVIEICGSLENGIQRANIAG